MLSETSFLSERNTIRAEVEKFKSLSLVSGIAALQLLPENAHSVLRLEFLAHAASGQPEARSAKHVLGRHLDHLCNTALRDSQIVRFEDPQADPFIENLGFHGGNHLLINGVFARSAATARLFASSINTLWQHTDLPPEDHELVDRALRLFTAALTLSDRVAKRARLHPGLSLEEIQPGDVTVPSNAELDRLRHAVTFTRPDLETLLTQLRLAVEDLGPLISAFPVDTASYDLGSGPLLTRPLLQVGDQLIVTIPSAIVPAACHALIAMFVRADRADLLEDTYASVAWRQVEDALSLMGNHPLTESFRREPPFPSHVQEGRFSLDVDKVLYVVLVRDTLTDYDPDAHMGGPGAPVDTLDAVLERRIRQLYTDRPETNDVFLLVVTQTFREFASVALNDLGNLAAPMLISYDELRVIAHLEHGRPLRLYKFTQTLNQLREGVRMFPLADTLDIFAFYRDRDYSLYLSDDAPPSAVMLGSGGGLPLREEVQFKWQEHFAVAPDGLSYVPVANAHHQRGSLVYGPLQGLDGRIGLLVSGLGKPLWVLSEVADRVPDPAMRELYVQFVNMLAYWGWQCAPVLADLLSSVRSRVVNVQVILDPTGAWHALEDQDAEGPPLDVRVDRRAGSITITVQTGILPLLRGPDNAGERAIVRDLLLAVADLAGMRPADETVLDQILDRFAPLGRKKHLLLLDPVHRPELIEGRLPKVRLVQSEDRDRLLDLIGAELLPESPVGRIPDAERTAVLNAINGFLFKRFEHRVQTLSGEGLMQHLLERHESLVRESTFHAVTVPTQLACYAPMQEMTDDIAKRARRFAESSLASRFLIEYVAAQPPAGLRPLSLTVYDELMAIASSVISFGFESDFIQYELVDIPLEVLPSRRLGADRNALGQAMRAYQDVFSRGEAARATAAFPRLWGEPDAVVSSEPHPIESAVQAELGLSLQALWELLNEAFELARGDVLARPRPEVVDHFAAALHWSTDQVEHALRLLTLTPRADFLHPSAPFQGTDVYPWRFNRSLSFLQRPFLQVGGHLMWGPRSVRQAGQHLTTLLLEGRYRAQSAELQASFGRIANQRGESFNREIVSMVRGAGYDEVTHQLKRVAGLAISGDQGTLGDIDVFIVDRPRRRLLLLECKNLANARTPAELANEMKTLLVGRPRKKAIVQLHGRRAQWFEDHRAEVLASLGVEHTLAWQIVPLVVVDTELMAASFAESPMPIVPKHQLLGYLRS